MMTLLGAKAQNVIDTDMPFHDVNSQLQLDAWLEREKKEADGYGNQLMETQFT